MKPTRLFATIILASTAGAPVVAVVATCASCQSGGIAGIADAPGWDAAIHDAFIPDAPNDRWSTIADAFMQDGELPDAGEGDAS